MAHPTTASARPCVARRLDTGPVTIAYDDHDACDDAQHPPLVLLHGLSADRTSWAPVVDRFASRRRVVAVDLRGHGRSLHAADGYRLAEYAADVDAMLQRLGRPVVLVGHSLGAILAAHLAQAQHPLVRDVFLEDPPLHLVHPAVFPSSSFGRAFEVLREHVARLQAASAPVDTYAELLARSPHPSGGRLGDHLHPDAIRSRAGALAAVDPAAIDAVLDGTTFAGFVPDRPVACPVAVLRADARLDPGMRPEDVERVRRAWPHATVHEVEGAAHNIRGDRAGRERYLHLLGVFLSTVVSRRRARTSPSGRAS